MFLQPVRTVLMYNVCIFVMQIFSTVLRDIKYFDIYVNVGTDEVYFICVVQHYGIVLQYLFNVYLPLLCFERATMLLFQFINLKHVELSTRDGFQHT